MMGEFRRMAVYTWVSESVLRAPQYELEGVSQDSIFEAPPQTSQYDALISMAGGNP